MKGCIKRDRRGVDFAIAQLGVDGQFFTRLKNQTSANRPVLEIVGARTRIPFAMAKT